MNILTESELAEIIGVSQETTRRWAKDKKIPIKMYGPSPTLRVFDADQIEEYLPKKYLGWYKANSKEYLTEEHQTKTNEKMIKKASFHMYYEMAKNEK